MNIINNITFIISGLALSLTAISCDNIKEGDRYEPIRKPSVEKRLLLLEFTGMRCTNCPMGAAAIHNIQEEFPGDVVAVGLHPEGGGTFTAPIGNQNFRSEEAQVMYEYYLPNGFPCAVFNGDKSTASTSSLTWGSTVYEIFSNWEESGLKAGMGIVATTSYNSSTRELEVDYSIDVYKNYSYPVNILIWVMENNIVGYQLDGNTYVEDYVHNHVLRASLNGDWGQELPQLKLTEGAIIEGKANMILNEKWVPENCEVVIFTFQADNRLTEQVTTVNVNAE